MMWKLLYLILFRIIEFILSSPLNAANIENHHFVFPDKCRSMPSNYCSSKVENSVCNEVKDECYCQTGYVVVREINKSTCKPLLLDLACRVDSDCLHVMNSMCHPGAGHCVCPSRSLFVPQHFICRRRYEDTSSSKLCRQCKILNGQCFLYDQSDMRRFRIANTKSRENVGCVCPGNRVSISNNEEEEADPNSSVAQSKSTTTGTAAGICMAKLVDIDQACNSRDLLCWSIKAICVPSSSISLSSSSSLSQVCQCKPAHVAVYQNNLRFYECLPVIPRPTYSSTSNSRNQDQPRPTQAVLDLCSTCHNAQGHCFYSNSIEEPQGCACPVGKSNQENGAPSLVKPCSITHLKVDCLSSTIRLCFLPYTHSPYENMKQELSTNRAELRVRGQLNQGGRVLATSRDSTGSLYCGEVSLLVTETTGILGDTILSVQRIGSDVVEYLGVLEVIREAPNGSPVLSLPFQCRGKVQDNPGLLSREASSKTRPNSDSGPATTPLQLELRLLATVSMQEASSIFRNTPIQLDTTLIDSRGFYTDLAIEACHLSNSSSLKSLLPTNQIYSRCLPTTNFSLTTMIPPPASWELPNIERLSWQQLFPGIHYRSSSFILHTFLDSSSNPSLSRIIPPINNKPSSLTLDSNSLLTTTEMFLHCQISLCKNQQACHRRKCGESSQNVHTSIFYRYAKFRMSNSFTDGRDLRELSPLKDRNLLLNQNRRRSNDVTNDSCPYSLCLNQLQAIMTSCLLLLLLLLVVVLLLVLFRRQRMLHSMVTNNNSSMPLPRRLRRSSTTFGARLTNFLLCNHKTKNSVTNGDLVAKHHKPYFTTDSSATVTLPTIGGNSSLATTCTFTGGGINGSYSNTLGGTTNCHGNFYLLTDSLNSSLDNLYSPSNGGSSYYPCPTFPGPPPHSVTMGDNAVLLNKQMNHQHTANNIITSSTNYNSVSRPLLPIHQSNYKNFLTTVPLVKINNLEDTTPTTITLTNNNNNRITGSNQNDSVNNCSTNENSSISCTN